MEECSVYDYQNPRQFLLDRVSALQRSNSTLSVRQLASKMGFSHTLLLLFLQGKRPLRVKHASALAAGMDLSSQERLYLQALIQFAAAQDLEEKRLCQLWMSELHPNREVKCRQLEQFELVANWIHMAILSLSETHDFDSSPEAIAKRLGASVSVNEVRSAVERLRDMGLIHISACGKISSTQTRVTTPDDVANAGARRYHREVMGLAQEALDRVPLAAREFQAFSISLPLEKVPLAKELIRKFRGQFAKAMGGEAGDEVFQLNIQFFQLTESPSRPERHEDEGVEQPKTFPRKKSKEKIRVSS